MSCLLVGGSRPSLDGLRARGMLGMLSCGRNSQGVLSRRAVLHLPRKRDLPEENYPASSVLPLKVHPYEWRMLSVYIEKCMIFISLSINIKDLISLAFSMSSFYLLPMESLFGKVGHVILLMIILGELLGFQCLQSLRYSYFIIVLLSLGSY